MLRGLLSATTTGLFCSGFAFFVSQLAPMLNNSQILATSFVSGFLGSVVAQMIIRK